MADTTMLERMFVALNSITPMCYVLYNLYRIIQSCYNSYTLYIVFATSPSATRGHVAMGWRMLSEVGLALHQLAVSAIPTSFASSRKSVRGALLHPGHVFEAAPPTLRPTQPRSLQEGRLPTVRSG